MLVCWVQQQPLRTINKLVYDHKVILHRLLVNLSKVRLANVDETVAKFEDEGSVCVGSVIKSQVDVGAKRFISYFVTATTYKLLILTWKKLVDPSVMIGDRTSLFDTTWIRNTSAIDRLETRVRFRIRVD